MRPNLNNLLKKKTQIQLESSRRCKTPAILLTLTGQRQSGQNNKPAHEKCSDVTCRTLAYKEKLCKVHYLERLERTLRAQIRNMYKDPETAFATFNFQGKQTIVLDDLLDHMLVKKIGYDREDIKIYLLREKVFAREDSELDYLKFKKFFFPQLMLIEDRAEHDLVKQEDTVLDTFNQIAQGTIKSHLKTNLKFDSARLAASNNMDKVKQLQK